MDRITVITAGAESEADILGRPTTKTWIGYAVEESNVTAQMAAVAYSLCVDIPRLIVVTYNMAP